MVAPSGQQLLSGISTVKIICLPCWLDADDLRDVNGELPEIKFAADPETVAHEAASAIPNLWKKRN